MRSLARPRDQVPLDPERAEHDAEREIHRLQDRALLDVQLQVGSRVLELAPRVERRVEIDAVRADRVGERDPVRVAALPQLGLVVHRPGGGARAEQRAPEARALLVGPAHEADGHRGLALLGEAAQDLGARDHVQRAVEPAAVGDGVEVPADENLALARAAQRPPLVSGLVELVLDAANRRACPASIRAPSPRSRSRRHAGRRRHFRSARAARGARRRCGPVGAALARSVSSELTLCGS